MFNWIWIIFWLLTLLIFFPIIKINAYNQEYYTTDDCGNNMLYSYVRWGSNFTWCEQWFYYYTPDCYRIEYMITWKNWDWLIISTWNCFYGGQPNYLWTTPMRNDIENCEFRGWNQNYSVIKWPQTYTATYFCWRTVTYKSWSDTLWTQEVNYWEKVWNISILSEWQKVTSAYLDEEKTIPFDIDNAVITWNIDIYVELWCVDHYHEEWGACILDTYNIYWKNWDGTIIKTDIVEYNNYPKYLWETPTKPDDECYTYPFRDWFPQIGKAIQDTSYTAQYYQYNRYFDVIYMDWENEIERDQANCGTYWLRDYIEKTWYVFEWWYTDKNYLNSLETESIEIEWDVILYGKWEACPEWQSVVNNKCANVWITYQDNVTTYIDSQWDEFEMWSITVSNGEDVITLLDRNLWATATWWEEAYWYHFQWWNNYGFDPNKSIKTRTSKVDASDYYRYNPYYSDTFYTNSNSSASARDSSNNNDLWWWINQWEPSIWYRMQWPCPAGYHVPSADEWATLLEIYHDLDDRWSSLDWYYPAYEVENRAFRKWFQDAFYIAYAWFRDNNASLTNQWSVARFWTSTPYDDWEGKQSWRFYLDKNRVDLSWVKMQRLNGYSVRCFLDTDEESVSDTVVLSFDTRWWTKISSKTLHRWDSFDMQLIPAKKDDKFVGWYMDKNLIQSYNGLSLERDTTLYAKYMSDLIVHENYVTTYTDTQWKVFNMWTFTIEADWYSITLLDRNLWATSTNWEDAYWYYFQWWNNYWFSWYNAIQTSNTLVDASDYAWDNPYVDDHFIVWNSNWDNFSNSDLWWDNTDTQAARQWPCPAWYHVPTLDEWEALIDAYAYYSEDSYGSTAFREWFQDTFKIPLAGRMRYRDGSSMSAWEVENEWSHARIWASDDNSDLAWRFYLWGNTVDTNNNSEKAYWYQVRCFKNSDVDTVTLFYEVNGWTPMQAQTLSKWDEWYLPWYETTKKWDELKWWYSDISMTQEFDFNTTLMQDTIIYAKWWLSHVVTFVDRDGSTLKTQIVNDWWSAIAPQTPFRWWYAFNWWDLDFSNVIWDMVITAQYTKNQSTSNWWWGGWGWSSLKRDICPDGDYSDSYYDWDCGKKPIQKDNAKDSSAKPNNDRTWHNSAKNEVVYDTLRFNPYYSDEMNQAYQFAYHYGITTKTNIKDAAMNWELTRIAMAKMLSQYAVNVLWIKPDVTRNNEFADVSDKLDTEYGDWVTLAYQLWIMWINMPNNEFRPYWYVTRAEFATALSRLLYNTSDWEYEKTSKYYVPHINKLAYEWILTNTNPYMKELRGYVMLMLMRSAK